jgi:hypothetical protein
MKINKNNQVYNNFKEEVIKDIKEENKYNGWSNYYTWCFKLWMHNNESLYNNIYSNIETIINNKYRGSEAPENPDYKMLDAMDFLKIIAEEMTQEQYKNDGTFTNDLIGYALNQINYNEVATAIIEDIKQELN